MTNNYLQDDLTNQQEAQSQSGKPEPELSARMAERLHRQQNDEHRDQRGAETRVGKIQSPRTCCEFWA